MKWIYRWMQCNLLADGWDVPPSKEDGWELLSLSVSTYPVAILLWRKAQ